MGNRISDTNEFNFQGMYNNNNNNFTKISHRFYQK